jgi:hypothetical protein
MDVFAPVQNVKELVPAPILFFLSLTLSLTLSSSRHGHDGGTLTLGAGALEPASPHQSELPPPPKISS